VTNVILVDSVVNEGMRIRRAIGHVDSLLLPCGPKPRLFVLTGVMQAKSSSTLPAQFPRIRFLTLRVSENKYSGQGGTDTGNRLFGTIACT
jgi:hypothetical protein